MLWQVQDPGIIPECRKVLLRLTILDLAYLRLSKTEPPSEQFLIERLAKQLKMARMVSICLENLADVLTFESCPKLIRLEKRVSEFNWWRAKLIAFLPVTPAAQTRGVVSREHCPAACAGTAAAGRITRGTSLRTGRAHLIPTQVGVDLPLTSVHALLDGHHRVT
jgi:hypothetical protein